MIVLFLVGGLAGLVLGGELLVRGAVAIATRYRVPPLVIGLTLVGFGTSMPELVTSVQAALAGSPGIAVGNVVGSNIANILLILGIAAVIRPFATDPAALRRDGAVLVLATLGVAGLVLSGVVGRVAGTLLVAGLLAYLIWTYAAMRGSMRTEPAAPAGLSVPLAALASAGGLVLTILGARLLVDGAIDLARTFGVSEAIIGLTIVAVGTSLPELVTSVVAARRGQGDIAFGNIVGSNIFNLFGILGATALVSPLAVPEQIARIDIWVLLGATGLMVAACVSGLRVSRAEGAAMVLGYGAYLGLLGYLA